MSRHLFGTPKTYEQKQKAKSKKQKAKNKK